MYSVAKEFNECGFEVVPFTVDINGTKSPTDMVKWVNDFKGVDDWRPIFEKSNQIGVICGARSGGVQFIDIDQKNDPTQTINNEFIDRLKYICPDILDKLYIETTISGGLHFGFKRKTVGKKLIPAKGPDGALIEILGEGQLCLCVPSKGYSYQAGELENLEYLDDEEFEIMLDVCKSFNQMNDDIDNEISTDTTDDLSNPGDDWGNQVDFPQFMQAYGWKIVGKGSDGVIYLRRPGKESGVSATWNYQGLKRLYIFSSSVSEFKSMKLIKPFHVLSIYEHEGNHKKASMYLRSQGYGDSVNKFKKMFDNCKEAKEIKQIIMDNDSIIKLRGREWEELKMHIEGLDVKKISDSGLDKFQKALKKDIKEESDAWEDLLEYSGEGEIKPKLNNIHIIFKYDEKMKGLFKFNEFSKTIFAETRAIDSKKGAECEEITDVFISQLRVWLSINYQEFKKSDIEDVMRMRAHWQSFHPLKEKLESFKWDGVERVDTWLIDMMGAKDIPYVRQVGRMWLVGALARVYRPGCQMDTMLIIEGGQGDRKSTFFRMLALDFFTDRVSDLTSKDSMIDLFGNWIVEFSELSAFKGKSPEIIKSFITRQIDPIRLPFEKFTGKHPRQNVFVGTTNDNNYLHDETGNRRYWPVKTTKIDLNANVEQLWAEALILFNDGVKWWPENTEVFEKEQSERMIQDETAIEIIEYMEKYNINIITTKQVHLYIMRGKMIDLNRYSQKNARSCKIAGLTHRTIKNVRSYVTKEFTLGTARYMVGHPEYALSSIEKSVALTHNT